jgi:hypothetical protein
MGERRLWKMKDDGPASLGWIGGEEIWYVLLDLHYICVCCPCHVHFRIPCLHSNPVWSVQSLGSDRISPGPARPVQHGLTRRRGSVHCLVEGALWYSYLDVVVFYSGLN